MHSSGTTMPASCRMRDGLAPNSLGGSSAASSRSACLPPWAAQLLADRQCSAARLASERACCSRPSNNAVCRWCSPCTCACTPTSHSVWWPISEIRRICVSHRHTVAPARLGYLQMRSLSRNTHNHFPACICIALRALSWTRKPFVAHLEPCNGACHVAFGSRVLDLLKLLPSGGASSFCVLDALLHDLRVGCVSRSAALSKLSHFHI